MDNGFLKLDLKLIQDPESPLRLAPDDPEIVDLAESISRIGLINPIRVKKVEDHYEVIAGHRRLLACRLIEKSPVECMLSTDHGQDDLETSIAENVARLDLSPIEEAVAVEDLRVQKNYGRRTVAKILGKSEAWVQQRIDLLKLPDDLKEAVHSKGLAIQTAFRLSEVDDPETRAKWIHDVLKNGVSARTVVLWVNSYKLAKAQQASVDLDNLDIEDDSEPYVAKGECFVCNEKVPYEKMKNILLCPHCYINIVKAMSSRSHYATVNNRVDTTSGRDGGTVGQEISPDGG